jgi:hypothetical protein
MTTNASGPSSKRDQRLLWIFGFVVLIALVTVAAPVLIKQKKAADRTTALSGIRQIGMSLFEFDSDYGSFPDDATALKIPEKQRAGYKLTGDHSNDYFRQLIVVGLKSERPFWCKTSFSPKKPDDDSTPSKALQAGEVGYSYIMAGPGEGQNTSGDPGRPLVVAPSYQAQADWTFDFETYDGRAIVLKLDNSAAALPLDPATNFARTGITGRYLQTTGKDTPWGGMTPVLKAPATKGK